MLLKNILSKRIMNAKDVVFSNGLNITKVFYIICFFFPGEVIVTNGIIKMEGVPIITPNCDIVVPRLSFTVS